MITKAIKINATILSVVVAAWMFVGCQQDEIKSVKPDDLYNQGLSLDEIAFRLNAEKLPPPKAAGEQDSEMSHARLGRTIIQFADNGVCQAQEAAGLQGCTDGYFFDPASPYFYRMERGTFYVHQSLGPGKSLAEAGNQFYAVFDLDNPAKNHRLDCSGSFWTKYSIRGKTPNKKVYFDLESLQHRSGNDITLWFFKDGRWRYYERLGVGPWLLRQKGISEFQIRCTSGSILSSYAIDGITVENISEL